MFDLDIKEFLFVVALFGIIVAMILLSVESERRWDVFAAEHNCKVVGKQSGSSGFGTGITAGGKVGFVSVYTPGKTGYSCDDGVTYWR